MEENKMRMMSKDCSSFSFYLNYLIKRIPQSYLPLPSRRKSHRPRQCTDSKIISLTLVGYRTGCSVDGGQHVVSLVGYKILATPFFVQQVGEVEYIEGNLQCMFLATGC